MATQMNVPLSFVRRFRHYQKSWRKDAVLYDQVKYHPVKKDHVDPPIVPSKVLMIHRVKPIKGNPWWEKDIIAKLGFREKENKPVFVKNTPEMCIELWRVKHLIKIVPVTTPDNFDAIDDLTEYYAHPTGTIYVTGKLDPARVKATEEFRNSMKRLEYPNVSEKLRLQWLQGALVPNA
ncbi:PREDICTED: uncharacterized protein LOC107187832 [Dufourea novaeangliae]|uniref:Large ribosomal subunit protein uL30m n=1 Tax=Dufourea novaeangliae TaxID=178035 RepID=A0A154PEU3_DUFNO|nr:PREDICTED: uncharacterized protein LOC107187832 [Dufourea novaeangliae]KZC09750.1 39S ribosomal protein L30, mitochondrial [Dufourea novaeangliae]